MLRILTVTTLYPNASQPAHGVFVENRLRALVGSGQVTARVVAPVPWFPSARPLFGRYARYAAVPEREDRHGITIDHPRYAVLPRVGTALAPLLLYAGVHGAVRRLVRTQGPFDLIDAHYLYPDGIAAVMLGADLGLPVVVTARGTDVNLMPDFVLPRRWITWASDRAAALVCVCEALRQRLLGLGIPADKVTTLRNGVDLTLFQPADRAVERRRLGLSGRVLLSVGLLIERKGHPLVIEALTRLPRTTLLIAGDGPDREALGDLARRLGVDDRVRFLGPVAHEALPGLYTAADALVLASSREGWANVLLEAMACGTPVVATDVWGTGEVVTNPAAGVLVAERTAGAIADAIARLLAAPPDRAATRSHAERFGWQPTTDGQIALFHRVLAGR